MIRSCHDHGRRRSRALVAFLIAFCVTFVASPLPTYAGLEEGGSSSASASGSGESGGSKSGSGNEKRDPEAGAANTDADKEEPLSDWAAHLGNQRQVDNADPIEESGLIKNRRIFKNVLFRWKDRSEAGKSWEDFKAAEDNAYKATDDLYPEAQRVAVGAIDGRLAQHMTDMFAAEAGLGPRVGDAIDQFKTAYTKATVKDFRKHIESREKAFNEKLQYLNNKYGDDRGQGANRISEREWSRVEERRNQLRHVIDVTIPALKAEVEMYRMLKDSKFGDERVVDQKRQYVRSMQAALRQEAAKLHDQQLFLADESVRLSDLERVGGAMGEVHQLVVDWKNRNVDAPADGNFNGGFKPDDGVDLSMDLNVTGVQTAPTMRMGARAVAYARVAECLGFGDMVPRTELAKIDGKYGVLQEWVDGDGPVTIKRRDLDYNDANDRVIRDQIMEAREWSGKMVSEYEQSKGVELGAARQQMEVLRAVLDEHKPQFVQPEAEDDDAPQPPELIRVREAEYRSDAFRQHEGSELRRRFAVAEILDRLTGQVDRHPHNFIIGRNGRLMLIDNDQAFGHHTDAVSDTERYGKQSDFPAYIDSEMADKIRELKPKDLRMATIGLLTGPEQEALVKRLLSLQAKVNSARSSGNLIYRVPPQDGGPHKTWSNDGADLAKQQPRSYYATVADMAPAPN